MLFPNKRNNENKGGSFIDYFVLNKYIRDIQNKSDQDDPDWVDELESLDLLEDE